MHYKAVTDSAVKTLLFLAKKKQGRATVREIADHIGMSGSSVQNIMAALQRRAGWIKSYTGMEGGYSFTGDAEKISVYDIQKAMGDEFRLNSVIASKDSALYETYNGFMQNSCDYFSKITLGDLLAWDGKRIDEEDKKRFENAPGTSREMEADKETIALQERIREVIEAYETELDRLKEERDIMKAVNADMYGKLQNIMGNLMGTKNPQA